MDSVVEVFDANGDLNTIFCARATGTQFECTTNRLGLKDKKNAGFGTVRSAPNLFTRKQ